MREKSGRKLVPEPGAEGAELSYSEEKIAPPGRLVPPGGAVKAGPLQPGIGVFGPDLRVIHKGFHADAYAVDERRPLRMRLA